MFLGLLHRESVQAEILVAVKHDASVVGLAAPETLCPYPTKALLDRFLPHVAVRAPLSGRAVPVDVTVAQRLLGFTPVHLYPVGERDL